MSDYAKLYVERLRALSNGLSEDENKRLEQMFQAVSAYVKGSSYEEVHIGDSDKVFFVQAKGDLDMALAFQFQYRAIYWYCDEVDLDKIFSADGGWPDFRVRGKHASRVVADDYSDFEEGKYPEPPPELIVNPALKNHPIFGLG